jgi:integrase
MSVKAQQDDGSLKKEYAAHRKKLERALKAKEKEMLENDSSSLKDIETELHRIRTQSAVDAFERFGIRVKKTFIKAARENQIAANRIDGTHKKLAHETGDLRSGKFRWLLKETTDEKYDLIVYKRDPVTKKIDEEPHFIRGLTKKQAEEEKRLISKNGLIPSRYVKPLNDYYGLAQDIINGSVTFKQRDYLSKTTTFGLAVAIYLFRRHKGDFTKSGAKTVKQLYFTLGDAKIHGPTTSHAAIGQMEEWLRTIAEKPANYGRSSSHKKRMTSTYSDWCLALNAIFKTLLGYKNYFGAADAYITAFNEKFNDIKTQSLKDGTIVRSLGQRCLRPQEYIAMFNLAPNIQCVSMLGFALSTGIRATDLKIVSRKDFLYSTGELLYNHGKLNRTDDANIGQKMAHIDGFHHLENPRTSTIVIFLFLNPEYFDPDNNRQIIEDFFFGDKRNPKSMKSSPVLARIAHNAQTREATAMDLRPTAATMIGYQITDIREAQLRLGHISGITTADSYDKVSPPLGKVFDHVKPPHIENPSFDQIKDWRCYEYLGRPRIRLKNGEEWKDIWHWDTFIAKMVLEQIAMRKGDEFGKTYKTKAKATEALQHWIDTVLLVQFEAAINHTRDRLEARRRLIGDQILDLSSAGTLLKYNEDS